MPQFRECEGKKTAVGGWGWLGGWGEHPHRSRGREDGKGGVPEGKPGKGVTLEM